MLKTKEGRTIRSIIKENDDRGVTCYAFTLDGATSEWKGHEGQKIDVCVTSLWVRLYSDNSDMKIPNMMHDTLPSMIENAAEVLLFQYGMDLF